MAICVFRRGVIRLSKLGDSIQNGIPMVFQTCSMATNKHYDPRHKKSREMKYGIPFMLPVNEKNEVARKWGFMPPVSAPPPVNVTCTGGIYEQFVPPEGDGKSSLLSLKGLKDKGKHIKISGLSIPALRRLKRYEEHFTTKDFVHQAQDIYIKAHKALEDFGHEEKRRKIYKYATEAAVSKMAVGMKTKSLRWNFIESLEPPKVVHIRTFETMKDIWFSQITVRFHNKQTLALYDRHGRLLFGNATMPKDILEYVVFEKFIADTYSIWRVHGKVVPEWMPKPEPVVPTQRIPEPYKETPEWPDMLYKGNRSVNRKKILYGL